MNTTSKIEALLITKGEPMSFKYLAKQIGVPEHEILESISELNKQYAEREAGINLVVNDDKVALATAPSLAEFIKGITRKEDESELGSSALETLALVLYEGPISKPAIDKIRGVNSSYILRSLMVRGLIERSGDDGHTRNFLYKPTVELLGFIGIGSTKDLPEKELFSRSIKDYLEGSNGKNE